MGYRCAGVTGPALFYVAGCSGEPGSPGRIFVDLGTNMSIFIVLVVTMVPIAIYYWLHNQWKIGVTSKLPPDQQAAVAQRRLVEGLPPEAVQVVWGRPHDIDRKGGKGGDVLIWTWWERGDRNRKKIDKRVTFRNGLLEKWEDR